MKVIEIVYYSYRLTATAQQGLYNMVNDIYGDDEPTGRYIIAAVI